MPEELVIDRRFRGFERVAHGGYSSGLLAGRLGGRDSVGLDGPARVKLRGPVPMEVPLSIDENDAAVVLRGEDGVLAEATSAELALEAPETVSPDAAAAASEHYPGHRGHPFPGCFCCGPTREPLDGLRIFPGPLGESGLAAAPWTPDMSLGDERGQVATEFVWAAFDCPQIWALMLNAPAESEQRIVTGSLETEIREPVRVDQPYAIVSWPLGGEGRRLYAGAALLDANGRTVAISRQTAVLTPHGVPLGLARLSAGA